MKALALLSLVLLAGCAAHKPAKTGVDMIIPKEAITGDIRLQDCDLNSPPHCRHTTIPYRKGSEQFVVAKTGK